MDMKAPADHGSAATYWVDFFINPELHRNPDLLSRARVLVLMLTLGILVYLLVLALTIIPALAIAAKVVVPIMLGNMAFGCFLLYKLRQKGSYSLCVVLAVMQPWANILGTAVITGGPQLSPALQLLSIPCVMAFFLGGNYAGAGMATLSLLAVGFLSLAQSMGTEFPYLASPRTFPFSQSFLLIINLSMMATLAVIYELTHESLKQQRDLEHEKYLRLAATDPLTGLANRRMFEETLAARIELYGRLTPKRRFALCYLDLDKFKPVNDQHGHNVGDEVLNAVSSRLRLALRGADFIGRQGGDEFLLLLDSVHNAAAAEALSKRFLQLIREPINTSAGTMQVGGSIGFVLYPDHGGDVASLQRAADEAMYEAKRSNSGYKIFAEKTGEAV